jgi:PAS domain S-box-containing protein
VKGVLLCDESGHITNVNTVLADMLGYSVQELINKDAESVLFAVDREELAMQDSNLFASDHLKVVELPVIKQDGSQIYCSVTIIPEVNDSGEFIGSLALFCDTAMFSEDNVVNTTDKDLNCNEKYLELFETEEQERLSLSRDLHDGVGQYLAAASMYLGLMGPNVETNLTKEDIEFFTLAQDLIQRAIRETRDVSHKLMPPSINDFGFIECLKGIISDLGKDKFEIELNIVPEDSRVELPELKGLILLRSIRQLLDSALHHGEGSLIRLNLKVSENSYELEITDYGRSIFQNRLDQQDGIGLLTIENRIHAIGGIVKVVRKEESATVKIHLNK